MICSYRGQLLDVSELLDGVLDMQETHCRGEKKRRNQHFFSKGKDQVVGYGEELYCTRCEGATTRQSREYWLEWTTSWTRNKAVSLC